LPSVNHMPTSVNTGDKGDRINSVWVLRWRVGHKRAPNRGQMYPPLDERGFRRGDLLAILDARLCILVQN